MFSPLRFKMALLSLVFRAGTEYIPKAEGKYPEDRINTRGRGTIGDAKIRHSGSLLAFSNSKVLKMKKHWQGGQKEKASVTFRYQCFFLGRDDKTRTCDLAPPRRVRYQLRYIPFLYVLCSRFLVCDAKV